MKTVIRSLPGKITLFILCILLLAVSICSVVGAYVLSELEFYRFSREQLTDDVHYELLSSQVDDILHYVTMQRFTAEDHSVYAPERTNLRFLITGTSGTKVDSNLADPPARSDPIWRYRFHHIQEFSADVTAEYLLYAYLEDGLPVPDQYAATATLISIVYTLRYWLLPIAVGALLLSLLCYITLLCVAGRKPRSEHLYPGLLHRVPFDLLLGGVAALFLGGLYLHDRWYDGGLFFAVLVIAFGIAGVCALLGLSMSIAARLKAHTLVKNTVIYRAAMLLIKLCKLAGRLFQRFWRKTLQLVRSLPMIWRTGLVALGLGITDLFLLSMAANEEESLCVILWFLRALVLAVAMLYAALFMRKLQQGGKALATGKLEHRVDTSMMFWDFKEHGENLNRISDGMAVAVEQRLQSERMKTELITNVSHDIKTPLTSIINYSTLIAQEPCSCENHALYSDVLLRKSEHLKRLLDDLVEISKASTGSLEVQVAPCDAGVLLNQISGEYQQRLEEAGLTLIAGIPEEPVQILADSRRIWRILENLMGNICKYSLPGSRVFLNLTPEENHARIVLRNTSSTVLNVSAQELMERFVRGDSARSTEGNGLGLSIAQSLTQLQGGTMEITIDGDIFKVTLCFPLAQ